ncbi:uncharacterized protein [Dermacentor albipictus]|uniref:uncharacterized protein isoform X1 n=1 Tax=Dermacentor albipictus TaxID=60249 RepID=UPI0031FC7384
MIVVPVFYSALPVNWLRVIAAFCLVFNGATIAECLYSLVQERDFPVTLKPFPTYSKAIDVSITRMFTIAYVGVSAMAIGADLILLLTVKSEPYKALRTFFYWNIFHFGVDVTVILIFFVATITKYDVNKAFVSMPQLMFVATALRASILCSLYRTFQMYSPGSGNAQNEGPLVHVRRASPASEAN